MYFYNINGLKSKVTASFSSIKGIYIVFRCIGYIIPNDLMYTHHLDESGRKHFLNKMNINGNGIKINKRKEKLNRSDRRLHYFYYYKTDTKLLLAGTYYRRFRK